MANTGNSRNGSALLAMSVCAGGVCGLVGAAESPTSLDANRGRVVDVAHIYYNIVSGEKVITLIDDGQTAGAAGNTSAPIWSSLDGWCNGIHDGVSTSFFFVVDDNSVSTEFATGVTAVDFGDIAVDTLIDCVRINWITDHSDTDDDSDGIGDGVIGLAGEWSWYDADDGRASNVSTRLPIISIRFTDLPGDISGTNPGDPDNTLAGYSFDLDLNASSLGSSLMFEIGDSDGDLQGASFGNNDVDINSDGIGDGFSIADTSIDPATGFPFVDRDFDGLPDADLDGDGLFDWSYGVRFFQPGTGDSNGDGVIDALDGDIADSMHAIGVEIGSPPFDVTDLGGGNLVWSLDLTAPDAGFGSIDAFTLYDGGTFLGRFDFGGFLCTAEEQRPRGDLATQLFSPGAYDCCPADTNCDGVINFFDISIFLAEFNGPDCDYNGDGECNFFDISAFLADFAAGCP
ncbi:hypothetical protein COB72_08055 [bacterium]|nr:MAG: hypothetical protein COB72_08055 [bacterium]